MVFYISAPVLLNIPYLSPPSGSCPPRFAPRPQPAPSLCSGPGASLGGQRSGDFAPSLSCYAIEKTHSICAPVRHHLRSRPPPFALRSPSICAPVRPHLRSRPPPVVGAGASGFHFRDGRLCVSRTVALIPRVGWRPLLRRVRHPTRWGSLSLFRWGRSLLSRPHRKSSPRDAVARRSSSSPVAPAPPPKAVSARGRALPSLRSGQSPAPSGIVCRLPLTVAQ